MNLWDILFDNDNLRSWACAYCDKINDNEVNKLIMSGGYFKCKFNSKGKLTVETKTSVSVKDNKIILHNPIYIDFN